MGIWPIKLVCPKVARASVYAVQDVDLIALPLPDRMTNLWEIVNEDDPEPNGESKVAFAHTGGRDFRKTILAALGWTDSQGVILTQLEW